MALPNLVEGLKSLTVSGKPMPRIGTVIKEEANQFLKNHQIDIGSSRMSSKIGKTHRGNTELVSNVHGIVMNPKVVFYRYEVTINGIIVTKDQIELTKKISQYMSSDAQKSDCRSRCRDVITVLKGRQDGCLSGKRCVFFDLQSILFSLDVLEDNADMHNVMNTEMPVRRDAEKFYRYEVHIRKASEHFQIQLGDLRGLSEDLTMCDHSLAQLLDIATSQYAMFTPSEHVTFSTKSSFLMNPPTYGFGKEDTATFDDTQSYLAIGANKAVRFIEGPSDKGSAMGVVVQTKKTPFHREDCLLDKAMAYIDDLPRFREPDRVKLDLFLKGLWVQTYHSQKVQRYPIMEVSDKSARSHEIHVDGEDVSVEQYFLQKYEMKLKAPTVPLVECKGPKGMSLYFPMEVCYVCENQRVKTEQQTPSMTKVLIKKCAVPPSILLEQNQKTAQSLHLWDNNELSMADIKVHEAPMQLKADTIPPPSIEFANRKIVRVGNRCAWPGDRYLAPGECGDWGAYAFLSDPTNFVMADFEEFLNRFVRQCRQRGMVIEFPTDVGLYKPSNADIKECFEYSYRHNFEFLFAVHDDWDDSAHAYIKYAEREYQIVSQALRYGTLLNIVRKPQTLTLQNIVNKTNIKFGGLNYSLALNNKGASDVLDPTTLYIGIASSHPRGGFNMQFQSFLPKEVPEGKEISYPAPTVVGFSANIGPNGSFDFVGDFVYQQPYREEKVDVIALIVKRCTDLFKQRRGGYPKRVIVYRGGCSEGQFRMVLEYEIPMIKYAFRQMQAEIIKLTVISVNRMQDVRFFNKNIDRAQKPDVQNIQPGVVIDHTVVHPILYEFFLNSHRALQGTARTPKYTVLFDESNMELAQVESMSYTLCYGHQIVYIPTSLPSPVYIANRYAERGRKLYLQHMAHEGNQQADYEKLTGELSFFETALFGYRVNA